MLKLQHFFKDRPFIGHHYIVPVLPALFLYSSNQMEFTNREAVVKTIFVTLLFSLGLFYFLKTKIGKIHEAAIVITLAVLFLFSYEQVSLAVLTIFKSAPYLITKYLIFITLLGILAGAFYMIFNIKSKENLLKVTGFFNIFSLALLISILFQLKVNADALSSSATIPRYKQEELELGQLSLSYKPDIYLLILDGRVRSDQYEKLFGKNNSEFINQLESRGFYVPKYSTSNYAQTMLSVASELNLNYVHELIDTGSLQNSDNRKPLIELVNDNLVFKTLEKNDYKIVSIRSVTPAINPPGNTESGKTTVKYIDAFYSSYISLTPYFLFTDYSEQAELHAKTILYTFDHAEELAKTEGPKLIFSHILAPHPPFIFKADGTLYSENLEGINVQGDAGHYAGDPKKYIEGYIDQTSYIDSQILEFADKVLENSESPPIIIIHADHGSGLQTNVENIDETNHNERFSIFYALYMPETEYPAELNEITPVNTFRLIFDKYFGTQLGMLENKSYFSEWDTPYKVIDVTEKLIKNKLNE